MDIEIKYGEESLHVEVSNPYKMDAVSVAKKMAGFLGNHGFDSSEIDQLYLPELLPKMVRGVAGCESGCPANAYSLVRSGFKSYKLEYIDGGILTAKNVLKNGQAPVVIKIFPDF
jgi:hypothetical protein